MPANDDVFRISEVSETPMQRAYRESREEADAYERLNHAGKEDHKAEVRELMWHLGRTGSPVKQTEE